MASNLGVAMVAGVTERREVDGRGGEQEEGDRIEEGEGCGGFVGLK
jgi:hypothetical protein